MCAARITSRQDLDRMTEETLFFEGQRYEARILICMTGCRALGAADVAAAFRQKLKAARLTDKVEVVETGCLGLCARAPAVLVEPYEFFYGGVQPEDVGNIIETTIRKGEPVTSLCCTVDAEPVPRLSDIPFYRKQKRIVLENCGRIDPKRIEDAIGRGAYSTLVGVLDQYSPSTVIDTVLAANLRGRGGGGFPTGRKWALCRDAPGPEKYLICNADEGDPGAFMDRALLEADPHRVIEGMIIAAYAIGATHGFVYVRAEYPIAVKHISTAIEQARSLGLLGENIAGSRYCFDIDTRMGAGAFVCGEETALIASLEGRRGMPRPRPPFPVQSGYRGRPTVINNVETFANIPVIMAHGAEWYNSIGTEKSRGTKIFALAGKVNNTGLVEVPMGISLREVIFDIGGGVPKSGVLKAVQLGGPSGGVIPESYLDLPIDYDSLKLIGAIMGSGGLIVMDGETCVVDVARYFLEFVQAESCGKCVPCRIGTRHMLDILERICDGAGVEGDVEKLEALARDVQEGSLCGLGQTAPNPVLTTIRHFREEYDAHIHHRHCPAHACHGLFKYVILKAECRGCTLCAKACPEAAISGVKKQPHVLDEAKCVGCGACLSVCPFSAVARVHPDWTQE